MPLLIWMGYGRLTPSVPFHGQTKAGFRVSEPMILYQHADDGELRRSIRRIIQLLMILFVNLQTTGAEKVYMSGLYRTSVRSCGNIPSFVLWDVYVTQCRSSSASVTVTDLLPGRSSFAGSQCCCGCLSHPQHSLSQLQPYYYSSEDSDRPTERVFRARMVETSWFTYSSNKHSSKWSHGYISFSFPPVVSCFLYSLHLISFAAALLWLFIYRRSISRRVRKLSATPAYTRG